VNDKTEIRLLVAVVMLMSDEDVVGNPLETFFWAPVLVSRTDSMSTIF